MYSKDVTIVNPTGLHARPAAEFCKVAAKFKSELTIKRADAEKVGNAKSVITLMSMGLSKGTVVQIAANGEDEQAAVDALAELIESGFGEI